MTEISKLIIQCLKEHFDLQIEKLELLLLGADPHASVYKAKSTDHKIYFVKIRHGSFSEGHTEVVTLLQQAEVYDIIHPIKTIEGKQVQQIDDLTFMVYPFIEGETGFDQSLSDQQWIQFGKTIRKIHEIEVPKKVQQHLRLETFSPEWRIAVQTLYQRIDVVSDEIGTKYKEFLKKKKKTIEDLLDRAEKLSKKLKGQEFPFVLCHSDLHAGNLLLDEKDFFYLIDWDDPVMAPKERDLMFIGGGVGNVWNRPHEEALFYEGYGKVELNEVLIAYYRHDRILCDIVEFTKGLLLDEKMKTDRDEMYKQFVAMFEPNGVVDIAFEVDEKIID